MKSNEINEESKQKEKNKMVSAKAGIMGSDDKPAYSNGTDLH